MIFDTEKILNGDFDNNIIEETKALYLVLSNMKFIIIK